MNIDKVQRTITSGVGSHAVQHVLIAVFVFLSFVGILFLNYVPSQLSDLAVGQVSPRDIEAPRTYEVIDEQATSEAMRQAMATVGTVYVADPKVESEAATAVSRTFETVRQIQLAQGLNNKAQVADLVSHMPLKISDTGVAALSRVSPQGLEQLELITKAALHDVMQKGVKNEDLPLARKELADLISKVAIPPEFMAGAVEIGQTALRPDLTPNYDRTNMLQQEKSRSVEPVKQHVPKGKMVVRKGDTITPEQMQILNVMGAGETHFNVPSLLGVVIFSILALILLLIFLVQHSPELISQTRTLWLVALILVATAGFCRWLVLATSGYLAPVAAASMLIAILVDYRLALIATALLSVMVGIFTGEFSHAAAALITGSVGVLAVAHVSRRADLILASVFVCLANLATVFSLGLIHNDDWLVIGRNTLFYGGLDGALASMMAMGALPFLENLFDITTHIKLLELSNPGEPLLQKLMVEAPGTYHHSIIVANLADAAARSIGADGLLARVGAYYHDIGKMKRSTFFVENQLGCENPHDKLTPTLSTMIITSHVKEGIELAQKYKLPRPIMDFIDMHHGTRLVQYFYHQARKVGAEVPEDAFRYGGRKPFSKETAIVMIADTIEAKARLMKKPDRESIDRMVAETIKGIMGDGQLDDSDLSLRDLKLVAESFTGTLLGIYHNRVEYPKDMLQDQAAGGAQEAARSEQAVDADEPSPESLADGAASPVLRQVESPPVT